MTQTQSTPLWSTQGTVVAVGLIMTAVAGSRHSTMGEQEHKNDLKVNEVKTILDCNKPQPLFSPLFPLPLPHSPQTMSGG